MVLDNFDFLLSYGFYASLSQIFGYASHIYTSSNLNCLFFSLSPSGVKCSYLDQNTCRQA